MYLNRFLVILLVCILTSSCAVNREKSASRGRGRSVAYAEDLTGVRPKVPSRETGLAGADAANAPAPTSTVNAELETALSAITERNKQIQYAQGYRVQLYSGNDRTQANQIKDKIYSNYPGINVYISYIQPSFKVKVGDFTDRLEALKLYAKIKNDFPIALIVQEQINIQKVVE
jgi:biotin carboxyl carrier protein